LTARKNQRAGCRQVGADPETEECDAQRHGHPRRKRHEKRASDRIAIDRLWIRAQEGNQIIRFHVRVSRAINAASILRP